MQIEVVVRSGGVVERASVSRGGRSEGGGVVFELLMRCSHFFPGRLRQVRRARFVYLESPQYWTLRIGQWVTHFASGVSAGTFPTLGCWLRTRHPRSVPGVQRLNCLGRYYLLCLWSTLVPACSCFVCTQFWKRVSGHLSRYCTCSKPPKNRHSSGVHDLYPSIARKSAADKVRV